MYSLAVKITDIGVVDLAAPAEKTTDLLEHSWRQFGAQLIILSSLSISLLELYGRLPIQGLWDVLTRRPVIRKFSVVRYCSLETLRQKAGCTEYYHTF